MCDCGCNTCETKSTLMLNESLAPRAILSEGLKYHMDANKPLTEHLYRAGSTNYFNLWAEARSYYSRGIIDITNEDDLAVLTETHLGHFGMFEGKKVPLDFPIELNESYDYDEVAQSEFGMDYDQLGPGEKEWVRDEIDNMSMNEAVTKDYTIVTYGGKRLSVNNKDIPRLKSGKDVVGKSLKHAGQEEWILAKGKWKIEEPLNEYSSEGEDWDDDEIEIERDGNIISVKISLGDEVRYKGHKGKVVKTEYDGVRVNFPTIGESGMTMHFFYEDLYSKEGYYQAVDESLNEDIKERIGRILEAKKKKKKDNRKIGKPMRDTSGGKAYKVYVKDPKTKKIKTVRFGSGGLRAKINDKKARNAFAARHKCSTKKDKTKAGYWSCRLPRYAKLLGLKSNFSGFW